MSTGLLNDPFDIHGGGQDLIFPHHENELAQALGAGKKFARCWIHNGLLTVQGQKMSKSVGNILRIQEVLNRYPPDVLRLFFLGAHYHSPMDFTWERMEEAKHAYETVATFLARVGTLGEGETKLDEQDLRVAEKFNDAMDDDLNTPQAFSYLYTLVTSGNMQLQSRGREAYVRGAAKKIRDLGSVLGLRFHQDDIPSEIQELARKRDEARQKKNYDEADKYRNEIIEKGYLMMDSAGKTILRKKL